MTRVAVTGDSIVIMHVLIGNARYNSSFVVDHVDSTIVPKQPNCGRVTRQVEIDRRRLFQVVHTQHRDVAPIQRPRDSDLVDSW
jgi:hypothetical protein